MKAPDPEKVAALSEKAKRLGELKEHPSWQEIRALLEKRKEKHLADFAREIMARQVTTAATLQRELDYIAGFWDGAEWILNNPDQAETSLKAALKRVGTLGAIAEVST